MSTTISSLGAIHIGVAIALFVVASTTVALRFYCRSKQRQRLFADDWLSLVALVLALALVVEACLWSTKGGFGFPLMSLEYTQVITFFHILAVQRITYWFISFITKLSILLLYRRLFPVQMLFRHLTILIGVITLCSSIIGIVSFIYRYVTSSNQHVTLSAILADTSLLRFILSGAVLSFALDCIILCMPLPLIWSMNLNRNKKWIVSSVFLLGGLTCVSSALRIVFIYGVNHHSYQYALEGPSCIWSTVEALLSIVSACLPTLRPLFMRRRKGCDESEEDDEDAAEALGNAIAAAQRRRHRYLSVTSTMLSTTLPGSPLQQKGMQNFFPSFEMRQSVDVTSPKERCDVVDQAMSPPIQYDAKLPTITSTVVEDEQARDRGAESASSPAGSKIPLFVVTSNLRQGQVERKRFV